MNSLLNCFVVVVVVLCKIRFALHCRYSLMSTKKHRSSNSYFYFWDYEFSIRFQLCAGPFHIFLSKLYQCRGHLHQVKMSHLLIGLFTATAHSITEYQIHMCNQTRIKRVAKSMQMCECYHLFITISGDHALGMRQKSIHHPEHA